MGHEQEYDRESDYHRDLEDAIPKERILFINGNMRPASLLSKSFQVMTDMLSSHDVEIDSINLFDHNFQIIGSSPDYKWELPLDIANKIRMADGIVVGTPEWHGSMTGALKNFIDHIERKLVEDKYVTLVSTAGGPRGGINALNHMRDVFRSMHAIVLSKQTTVSMSDIISENQLDPMIHQRLQGQALDLIREVKRYEIR